MLGFCVDILAHKEDKPRMQVQKSSAQNFRTEKVAIKILVKLTPGQWVGTPQSIKYWWFWSQQILLTIKIGHFKTSVLIYDIKTYMSENLELFAKNCHKGCFFKRNIFFTKKFCRTHPGIISIHQTRGIRVESKLKGFLPNSEILL